MVRHVKEKDLRTEDIGWDFHHRRAISVNLLSLRYRRDILDSLYTTVPVAAHFHRITPRSCNEYSDLLRHNNKSILRSGHMCERIDIQLHSLAWLG